MASNTGSANPAEIGPAAGTPGPSADGRVWGITTKASPGTKGASGNVSANGKKSSFGC